MCNIHVCLSSLDLIIKMWYPDCSKQPSAILTRQLASFLGFQCLHPLFILHCIYLQRIWNSIRKQFSVCSVHFLGEFYRLQSCRITNEELRIPHGVSWNWFEYFVTFIFIGFPIVLLGALAHLPIEQRIYFHLIIDNICRIMLLVCCSHCNDFHFFSFFFLLNTIDSTWSSSI